METTDTRYDARERRCPRLGHAISFSYCRTAGAEESPCWKIADCWWEYFDVVAYLRQNLSPQAFSRIHQAQPKPKITSLVELIAQAKERTGRS